MTNGYLVYWVHCKTGHQKFRFNKKLDKAIKLRDNLIKQSKFLTVWISKTEDL